MMLTLDEVKAWIRQDSDEDDDLIRIIIGAAETYLLNATGIKYDESNQLAKLYCLILCADWYENRTLIGQQPSEKIRFVCQSIMTQLQYAGSGGDGHGSG